MIALWMWQSCTVSVSTPPRKNPPHSKDRGKAKLLSMSGINFNSYMQCGRQQQQQQDADDDVF